MMSFVCFVLVVCVFCLFFFCYFVAVFVVVLFVCLLMLLFCCLFHVLVFCCLFFVCLFCFVEVLDGKLNPMLAYASEIWETVRLDNIEKVPMMPSMRFFGVPLGTSNKMVYGEPGRCPLFVTNTLRCLKPCVF